MRLNQDFKLNVVAGESMLVNTKGAAAMTSVCSLNEPAAWLWKRIGTEEFDVPALVEWLCEEYEVDAKTAEADIVDMLIVWKEYGMVL